MEHAGGAATAVQAALRASAPTIHIAAEKRMIITCFRNSGYVSLLVLFHDTSWDDAALISSIAPCRTAHADTSHSCKVRLRACVTPNHCEQMRLGVMSMHWHWPKADNHMI